MIFGRRRNDRAAATTEPAVEEAENAGDLDPRAAGPWDVTEVDLDQESEDAPRRIDLGSLLIAGGPGLELRLQVSEENGQVVSAVLITGGSAVELAVFAAPRTGGLWDELQDDYVQATLDAGGTAALRDGPFGTELYRVAPVALPDGTTAEQEARVWMVDGPRWLLRGIVYGAAAAADPADDADPTGAAAPLLAAFRQVIVRRGNQPMGPGDALELQLPEGIERRA